MAQRLAEARAKNSSVVKPEVIDLCDDSTPEASPEARGPSGSGSNGSVVGVAGMVRSKRAQLILHCFTKGIRAHLHPHFTVHTLNYDV